MYMDGVDFTPASKNVLFGYQFKSIAALGPIGGPIVAAQWGWLPGLLWIILGTFFIGWVQDYASIIVPMRSEGDTFGALSYKLISPRARSVLLIFIYLYLLLIMGAFGQVIGINFMSNPVVPVGVLGVILMGLLAGQMTYKMKQDIILTTVITVVVAFIGIWLSQTAPHLALGAAHQLRLLLGRRPGDRRRSHRPAYLESARRRQFRRLPGLHRLVGRGVGAAMADSLRHHRLRRCLRLAFAGLQFRHRATDRKGK
jgi:carbon starvation protein CstA